MQTDTLLIQAERRVLVRAYKMIALMDSSKFGAPAAHTLCALADPYRNHRRRHPS